MSLSPRDVLIVNDGAPVTVYLRTDLAKTRRFKTWGEFRLWYDRKHHGEMNLPPNSQPKFTDLVLDRITDAPGRSRRAAEASEAATEKRKKGAASFGSGSVAVTVGGKHYGTIKGALAALGLPDAERKALRKALIETGTGTVGKYTFKRED